VKHTKKPFKTNGFFVFDKHLFICLTENRKNEKGELKNEKNRERVAV
jgi:hypothetical protein